MRNKIIVLAIVLTAVCLVSIGFAAPNAAQRFRHTDRNRDGIIDPKERHTERRWEHRHWIKSRAKVSNAVEAKYDKNGNGWLEPAETREMLKDKYELIKTNGKAKVDTPTEAEYDTNKDGIIDAKEAEAMFKDIK